LRGRGTVPPPRGAEEPSPCPALFFLAFVQKISYIITIKETRCTDDKLVRLPATDEISPTGLD